MITRGTTCQNHFKIPFAWDEVESLYITYKQNGETKLEKDIDDVTYDAATECVSLVLGQQDTLAFDPVGIPADQKLALVYIQLRIKLENEDTYACEPIKAKISDIIKEGII